MNLNLTEDRMYRLIKSESKGGELTMKVDDLASGISEGRGPAYAALKSLDKKGIIETQGRGKKGIQIRILKHLNESNDNKGTMTTKISLEGIRDFLASASEGDYKIIEDLIELNRLKRKKKR